MSFRYHLIPILVLIFILPSLAQEQKEEGEKQQNVQTLQEEDQESVKLFLDKINVSGHLDRPQAIFIIPGASPEIDDIQIERSFFKEIFRTVEKKGRDSSVSEMNLKNRDDYIPW